MANLATRVANMEKRQAPGDGLPRLIIIMRRYVNPGDSREPATDYVVAQGKVWARREDEDAEGARSQTAPGSALRHL